METITTITERHFTKDWGRSPSLILPRSSIWKSVKKSKPGNVSCATYIIYDPLYENRTYEAISNFEKGAKVNFCQIWLLDRQSRLNRLLLSDASWYVNKT